MRTCQVQTKMTKWKHFNLLKDKYRSPPGAVPEAAD